MSQLGLANTSLAGSNIVVEQPRGSMHEEDSLCFSRDHSKEMESVSSLLTYNDARKECVVIEPTKDPYTYDLR